MGSCLSLCGGSDTDAGSAIRGRGLEGGQTSSMRVGTPPPRPVRAVRPRSRAARCSRDSRFAATSGRPRGTERDKGRGR